MTVAEMIAQRTAALRTVLHDSDQAIYSKGGTPADDLSGLQDAILSIPSGGGALPVLTNPAEVGHVVAGKEYIDASGTKKAGTLVVCDTIVEVEHFGVAGTGVSLGIESSADGSAGELKIPEQHLLPENIKNGVRIFGVLGSAKTMRVETGTITPAADTTTLSIPCTDGAKAVCLEATADVISAVEGQSKKRYITSVLSNFCGSITGATNAAMQIWNLTKYADSGVPADNTNGFFVASNMTFYAGTYQWVAYYWEDD